MLHSKSILQAAGGRAAILRGGILDHILQECLSVDGMLNGPSAEVTLHCAGFVIPSKVPGYSYWDDDLTEYEIGIIIHRHVHNVYWQVHSISASALFW